MKKLEKYQYFSVGKYTLSVTIFTCIIQYATLQNFLDGGVGNLVGLGGGARAPAANQNEGNNEAPPPEAEEEGDDGEENGNNAAQGNSLIANVLQRTC